MARCGIGSRRACERLIEEGKVSVNGEGITTLGVTVKPGIDKVVVNGQILSPPEDDIYIMLNKPSGYITTLMDTHGRATVMDLIGGLGDNNRIYPVGRLDKATTGLLILTNDGEFTFRLTHPKFEVKKVYEALVEGTPEDRALEALARGVPLEDGITSPAKVRVLKESGGRALISLTIHEGKKRQVRRMCREVGHPVVRLKRVAFGPLNLGKLNEGEFRHLSGGEVDSLLKLVGLSPKGRNLYDNSDRRRSRRADGSGKGGRSRRRSAPFREERQNRKEVRHNRKGKV